MAGTVECEETAVVAGENQGAGQYTPLHWACSHRDHPKVGQEQVSEVSAVPTVQSYCSDKYL